MKRIYGTVGALALAASSALAQESAVSVRQSMDAIDKTKAEMSQVFNKMQMQIIGLEGGVMSNVKGAPYSAEQVTENTQTLGDGTRIHSETSVKVYRDGEGRVRREMPDTISIFDPVSGVGYTLNPKTLTGGKMQVSISVNHGPNSVSYSATATSGDGKGVRVFNGVSTSTETLPAGGYVVKSGAGAAAEGIPGGFVFTNSGPNASFMITKSTGKLETLPAQIMEGVSVQGERRTNTIEANEIGNDRPIQSVYERWYSPDLQVEVMTRNSDPRTGEQITRLLNVRRGEPDATLFQVPKEYTINEGKTLPALFKQRQQQ